MHTTHTGIGSIVLTHSLFFCDCGVALLVEEMYWMMMMLEHTIPMHGVLLEETLLLALHKLYFHK